MSKIIVSFLLKIKEKIDMNKTFITPQRAYENGVDEVKGVFSEDLSNPMWNTAAGGHTWDMVSSIANGNNTYDKDDTIFLTYMMKHIVRAGIKPYENKTTLQSKIIDLDKARTYMNAWIDKLEKLDEK